MIGVEFEKCSVFAVRFFFVRIVWNLTSSQKFYARNLYSNVTFFQKGKNLLNNDVRKVIFFVEIEIFRNNVIFLYFRVFLTLNLCYFVRKIKK